MILDVPWAGETLGHVELGVKVGQLETRVSTLTPQMGVCLKMPRHPPPQWPQNCCFPSSNAQRVPSKETHADVF